MPPDPRKVASLANEIIRLEEELAILKEKWRAMFNAIPLNTREALGSAPRPDSFATRVEEAVNAARRPLTITQVAELVHGDQLKVGRALFRLSKTQRIESPSRGMYRSKRSEEKSAEVAAEEEPEVAA